MFSACLPITKERANINEWAKCITPSTELRKNFHHDPNLLEEFKVKYIIELDNNEYASEFIGLIKEKLSEHNVTLLYAAKDEKVNHVVILKTCIEEHI